MNKQTQTIPNRKEQRLGNLNVETRNSDNGDELILEGYAALFDAETLIGTETHGFYERIAKTAFDGAHMSDVCAKYNHSDETFILARTRNKTLELTVDEKGLFCRIKLQSNVRQHQDIYNMVKSGLLDRMSFAFTVRENQIEKHGKIPLRTITKIDRLFDVSVVDVPAYDQTSIYARSLELVDTDLNTVDTETCNRAIEILHLKNEILSKFGGIQR